MSHLPLRPEDFSTHWLESVFDAPHGSLTSLRFDAVGTGQICDSYRFTCEWQDINRPTTFVAKCPSADADSRAAAALYQLYRSEVGWYSEFSSASGVSCPDCYFAAINDNGEDFALLLEDMAPSTQGDQVRGGSLQQVRSAVVELAKLGTYPVNDTRRVEIGWLNQSDHNREQIRVALPIMYPAFCEIFIGRLSTQVLELGKELMGRFSTYLDIEPSRQCLTHNDFRLDNMLFDATGERAVIVDWQTASWGNGISDLAYLAGTSFDNADERAECESGLLSLYLDTLMDRGVSLDYESAWLDYRRAAFSGLIMAVNASILVERTERGDEMFAKMAERSAQMAIDLESMSSF